ncbi:MAG: YgiT-type zinc finger protein [Microcystaceae cyanobacterium]
MKPKKCPNCQGELITKQVEKILKGGVNTAIVQIEAEVCLNCGERLYKPESVRQFAQIRAKLKSQETADFELIGQSFKINPPKTL